MRIIKREEWIETSVHPFYPLFYPIWKRFCDARRDALFFFTIRARYTREEAEGKEAGPALNR